jgi:hypothetical protein
LPLLLSIPTEANMVKRLGQIYDQQYLEAFHLTDPPIYRNPMTNEVISSADFFGGETPLAFEEKMNIRGVTFAYHYHRRSTRRKSKKLYDVLHVRARLEQHLTLHSSQMETRAWVQNAGGSTLASPPHVMVSRLIQQGDANLQVRGLPTHRVSSASCQVNPLDINLDFSDDKVPTVNPMENMPVSQSHRHLY